MPNERSTSPRHVLYVLFDDLRADLGSSSSASRSHYAPNIAQLANSSASFELAFSQVAFCVPSRSSFLTGIRPDKTASVHNDQILRFGKNRLAPLRPGLTVFDAFRKAGYTTAAVGKIFHFGEAHPSLDLPVLPTTHDLLGRPCDTPSAKDVRKARSQSPFGFPTACRLPFGSFVDERIAAGAIGYLRKLVNQGRGALEKLVPPTWSARPSKPFLLAVGFMRPHNPYQFPSQYLDRLPLANETDVAAVRWRHASQPALAFADSTECSRAKCSREQRRYYRGAVAHADEMLGLVLRELDRLRVATETLVVMHADHGFSLGENGAWQKRSNFDHATRVPLIIRDPTLPHTAGMRIAHAPVELTDVLPTLLDLSGAGALVRPPSHLQGRSLRPLLTPHASAHEHSFRYAFMLQPRLLYLSRNINTTDAGVRQRTLVIDGNANVSDVLPRDGGNRWLKMKPRDCSTELVAGGFGPGRACHFVAMGFSVRSKRWRYTRWERWPIDGNSSRVWTVGEGALLAEELYCYGCQNRSSAPDASGSEVAEEVNLAGPRTTRRASGPPAALVHNAKQSLMRALLSRADSHFVATRGRAGRGVATDDRRPKQ